MNALLDDGSTTSYLNERVAVELELTGERRNLVVKVIGGEKQKIQSQQVKIDLVDVSERTEVKFSALTMKSVVGELKVINWTNEKAAWKHLKDIEFPTAGRKGTVDVLIGNDFAELHRFLKEVTGAAGESIALLTQLGWTCIEGPGFGQTYVTQTSFVSTYLSVDSLDDSVRRFWELEEGFQKKEQFTKMETEIMIKATMEMKQVDGWYQVNLPWKGDAQVGEIDRKMV